MVTKSDVMEVLLDACPSFAPIWEDFLKEWEDEGGPPLYLALSAFAEHLIGMLERSETGSFPAIFQAVEKLLVEGDHDVKEAATVGLLEDVQNANLHSGTEPEQFRKFLGPESGLWWDKLYGFWERGEPL